MRDFIGYEEYFVQRRDLTLWYYKVAIYGTMHMILPSDHMAPTPGGSSYTNVSFDILEQVPLDKYEDGVRKQAKMEHWLDTASGRIEENDIIFDLLLFAFSFGGRSVAARVFAGASLLFNLAHGESEGPQGAVKGELINFFLAKALLRVANIKSEWILEIGTEALSRALPMHKNEYKKMGRATRLLEKIQAFRYHTQWDELYLRYLQSRHLRGGSLQVPMVHR